MRLAKFGLSALAFAALIAMAGCGHKVVAVNGEQKVRIFPSEDLYKVYNQAKTTLDKQIAPKDRTVANNLMLTVQRLASKEVESRTAVRIISKSDTGAMVEVVDGPNKGYQGFVPKENLD